MKHIRRKSSVLAAITAMILTFSVLPKAVFSSEGTIYKQILSSEAYRTEFVLHQAAAETSPPQPTGETAPPSEEPPTTEPTEEPQPEKQYTAPVTVSPDGGSLFIKETVSLSLHCETEGAVIYVAASGDGVTFSDYEIYTEPLVLQPGFGALHLKAYAQKEGWEPGEETLRSFTEQTVRGPGLYFGQLHSHSEFSYGTGSVQEAFAHAAEVPHLDFLAVTDYSNALTPENWAAGKAAAEAATDRDFVGIYSYEITWQEGSHINTFNTSEFSTREQHPDLPAYYASMAALTGSVSQFNHPGEVYGDFQSFGNRTENADRAVALLELGADLDITYYTQALDAGWHVAPTYSENNHDGNWGSESHGRTAVFADSLTEAGLYDGLSRCRVYATQDPDLSVHFSLDGYAMGSQLEKREVGSTAVLSVSLSDPTDGDSAALEVITEEGQILSQTVCEAAAEFTVSTDRSYYFLRITQADGDVAVTAPIRIDMTEDIGIADFSADTALPVQNQPLDLTLELYNNENCDLTVEKIVFRTDDEILHETDALSQVKAGDTAAYRFPLTYAGLGQRTVTAAVTAALDGQPRNYEAALTLTFQRADLTNQIIVDASHGNVGVEELRHFVSMAAGEQLSVIRADAPITAELLGSAEILIVSAPTAAFEDSFVSLVRDFLHTGGTVILCGQSDKLDASLHTSAQLNRLLSAMGSGMRLRDDTARDLENRGDSHDQIFPAVFQTSSRWCADISENQVYSHQSGCTVDVGSGTWLVKGHPTTDSEDVDGDGMSTAVAGEAVLLACEDIGGGTVFAAGSFFLTDTHTAPEKNIWDEPYANRTIAQTLLGSQKAHLPLHPVGEVRKGVPGEVYRVRGYVTAGTSNPNTTFPNTLYLQDDTGGIAAVPFTAPGIEIGTPMEVTGYLDLQNGNPVLEILDWQVLPFSTYRYAPETVPNREAMDYALRGGQILQICGEAVEVTPAGTSGVSRFVLKDAEGDLAAVWIGEAIVSGSTGENTLAEQVKPGHTVRAMGLLHLHSDGTPVLRVRNCDEVVYVPPLIHTPPCDPTNPQTGDAPMPYLPVIPLILTALILLKRRRRSA